MWCFQADPACWCSVTVVQVRQGDGGWGGGGGREGGARGLSRKVRELARVSRSRGVVREIELKELTGMCLRHWACGLERMWEGPALEGRALSLRSQVPPAVIGCRGLSVSKLNKLELLMGPQCLSRGSTWLYIFWEGAGCWHLLPSSDTFDSRWI